MSHGCGSGAAAMMAASMLAQPAARAPASGDRECRLWRRRQQTPQAEQAMRSEGRSRGELLRRMRRRAPKAQPTLLAGLPEAVRLVSGLLPSLETSGHGLLGWTLAHGRRPMAAALHAGLGAEDADYSTQLGRDGEFGADIARSGAHAEIQVDACAAALSIPKVRPALRAACLVNDTCNCTTCAM